MTTGRRPFGDRQIAEVFRTLSDEHANARFAADCRRAEQRMQAGQRYDEPPEFSRAFQLLVRRVLPALAAAFVALGVALWLMPAPLLEYAVEGARVEGGVVRTQSEPAFIRFSDKSAIEARPETTLNLDVVGERAALARLIKGDVRVAIQHDEETDWRFLAGPYEVRVVGTKFDLTWDPEQAALSVVMREGKVRIVGPNELDRELVAGERLSLARKKPETSPSNTPAPRQTAHNVELQGPKAAVPAESGAASAAVSPSSAARSWSALVAAGRFEDVVRDAQAEGLSRAHGERNPADLRALAQAAAYTGRTELAVKTWNVVRQRFQGRSAEQAAFFLGRIFDQNGRHVEALTWLRTYLREAPRGVYASEALGGVLTLVRRTEGNAAAKPLARTYLERFPKGSYAAAARAVLDGQ